MTTSPIVTLFPLLSPHVRRGPNRTPCTRPLAVLRTAMVFTLTALWLITYAHAQEPSASSTACTFQPLASSTMETDGPTALDTAAESMASATDHWEVVTFIHLRAIGRTPGVRFQITQLPGKGRLLDWRGDHWCRVPSLYLTERSDALRHALRYVPDRGAAGEDIVKFRAIDDNHHESTDATGTISIRRGGLRWQLSTNGTTGRAGTDEITTTAQDSMFRLDWQWKAPRSRAKLERDRIRVDPAAGLNRGFRTAHVTLLTGFAHRPRATLPSPESPNASSASGAAPTPATLTYQRALTVGAETHFGWAVDVDAQGTYAELGPVVGMYFDTFVGKKSIIKDGVPVKLEPIDGDGGYLRFETGVRLAVKRMGGDAPVGAVRLTSSNDAAPMVTLQARNARDLIVFDLLVYQHQNALRALLPQNSFEAHRRWAFRLMAMPTVPGRDDSTLLLGIEVSQDFENIGPRDVRLFYGLGWSR